MRLQRKKKILSFFQCLRPPLNGGTFVLRSLSTFRLYFFLFFFKISESLANAITRDLWMLQKFFFLLLVAGHCFHPGPASYVGQSEVCLRQLMITTVSFFSFSFFFLFSNAGLRSITSLRREKNVKKERERGIFFSSSIGTYRG